MYLGLTMTSKPVPSGFVNGGLAFTAARSTLENHARIFRKLAIS